MPYQTPFVQRTLALRRKGGSPTQPQAQVPGLFQATQMPRAQLRAPSMGDGTVVQNPNAPVNQRPFGPGAIPGGGGGPSYNQGVPQIPPVPGLARIGPRR